MSGAGTRTLKQLNNRRRRFVEEYLTDLNATQAAIRAGYSPRSASSIANLMELEEVPLGLEFD